MFAFVRGVYASDGAKMIINVWGEPEMFVRGTWKLRADGKYDGVLSLGIQEDAENIMQEFISTVRPPWPSTLAPS